MLSFIIFESFSIFFIDHVTLVNDALNVKKVVDDISIKEIRNRLRMMKKGKAQEPDHVDHNCSIETKDCGFRQICLTDFEEGRKSLYLFCCSTKSAVNDLRLLYKPLPVHQKLRV